MIIQALNQYYERLSSEPASGVAPSDYSMAKVSFAFNLSEEGHLLDIFPLYETTGKKKIAGILLVPEQVKRAAGVSSNFLCDNSSYVLGLDNKGKPARSLECFNAFRELHKQVLGKVDDKGSEAIINFLESREAGEAHEKILQDMLEVLFEGGNIVFMLEGERGYIHERPPVKKAWALYKEKELRNAYVAQCLVTGDIGPISLLHPSIKGVVGGQSSGASIVSFNDDAYISYGKRQSYNAPVSTAATFAYTTALNYLLASKKNRLQIADATTVFWADRHEEENLIAAFFDPPEEDEKNKESIDYVSAQKIRDILLQLRDGKKPVNAEFDEKIHFCILGLAPNAARISIRYYHEGEFGSLMKNVGLHYADMSVVVPKDYRHTLPAIWRILRETATLGKSENIPSILSAGLMQAVLSGNAYPRSLYTAIVSRIRADHNVNPIRVGILKAYLKRQARINGNKDEEGMLTMSLNEESTNQGYILGRLFALLERAQERASGGNLNSTIRDRYFGAASATPAAVFPILLRLSQHHLSKAEYGFAIDRQIQGVMNLLDGQAGFPKHLNLDDQGHFMLGYYQQRQAFYIKKEA